MKQLIITFAAFLFLTYSTTYAKATDVKLLYFYIDGCSWCQKMDQILQDTRVKRILASTDLIKIKVDGKKIIEKNKTEEELAKEYRIKGVPTIVFLNSQGEEFLRIPGLLSKEDFIDLLCSYVTGAKQGCK